MQTGIPKKSTKKREITIDEALVEKLASTMQDLDAEKR